MARVAKRSHAAGEGAACRQECDPRDVAEKRGEISVIDENCNQCKLSITLTGCPAITLSEHSIPIDPDQCYGCGPCGRASAARSSSCELPGWSVTMYDIYFVGVGGQGVLTIGEIITEAAFRKGILRTSTHQGMAQRGGFVKAQLRLVARLRGRPSGTRC
jgi:hypothetical protein